MLLCDFANLEREVRALEEAGVEGLHLDVMDGRFVPNFTYGMPIVEGIRRITDLPLDVHLMIEEPGNYVASFVDAGADYLTVHVEASVDIETVLGQIREAGVGVGLALNPQTELASVLPYLEQCDLVLVMSVPAGFGGQPFQSVAIQKLEMLRQARQDLLLEVDGGINARTISQCRAAGADLFVVGSGIFRSTDYRAALADLNQSLRRASLVE
jgi:ribulose-phosphate 3-epimerase